ncbi:MAG TPA: glutathione transferase GstA [Ramlibacter sp.]|nr:glutathione transferase GstA [Ramlibacter sp.]
MKLYFSPAACSLAVHIALREAGVPVDLASVDLVKYQLADGSDYRAINPRGYVPLLELDDGSRHTEVSALLQYVAESVPQAQLLPAAGSGERLQVLQWVTFIATELHKAFSPWLWHKETADSTRKAVKDKLALRFADIEQALVQREFVAGDRFTIADAYAFTILRWAPMLGISLKPYPHVDAYLQRIAARPAVHAALLAEGLVKA